MGIKIVSRCPIIFSFMIFMSTIYMVHGQTICEPLRYYNESGSTAVFTQKLPSVRWGVRITPPYIPRVDTAFIGFGLKKNSAQSVYDTLEIYILDNNPPAFTQLDKDVITLMPPLGQKIIPDGFYMMELDFNTPAAIINPVRDFWLAYKFKGPPNDSVRVLFKTPAANQSRSVVINQNGSTTLASTYVAGQISTTVDLWAEVHVCYPYGVPVEMQSYSVRYENNSALLEWTTASETQNFGFEIERVITSSESGRAKLWQRIGFVPGFGSTNDIHQYSFVDPDPLFAKDKDGFVTYRLRQIDFDGSVTLGPLLKLFVGNSNLDFHLAQNFPNPIFSGTRSSSSSGNPTTTIAYQISETAHTTIQIFDASGKLIDTILDEDKTPGAYTVTYDASHLSSGLYTYSLISGHRRAIQKMAVMK